MATEIVTGKQVRILFDGAKCIHSRMCVLSRPDVFVPNVEGEWIHPDRATPAEAAELAHNCPSGAIRYEIVQGDAPGEAAPMVNTVRVRENGPLAFYAELTIAGAAAGFRATLCRCGASHNKPFCDGSHHDVEFAATGEPAAAPGITALTVRNGPLNIEPQRNGPLLVKGALEVVTGTGKTVAKAMELWFCRCGHSADKPYCDGSHKRVGFNSEN
jgi:CDGSH-type Zn-finger protein/uncharacterized Fe-S cluster protein YjdI